MSSRSRRDIQLPIDLLTTRVNIPYEDDWGKLKHVLKYLKGTKHVKLTISVYILSIIKWRVYESDRTYMDCKCHSGYVMSLVKGAIVSFSKKKKSNTKSSTGEKILQADDVLPQVLWSMYFTDAQGYSIDKNTMFQDNMETMRLEVNGSFSSYKRTEHIKDRYLFIKYKIEYG